MTDSSRIADDNPLKGWTVDTSTITRVGHDLFRPECIIAESDGTLWIADPRTTVNRISPDGTQTLIPPLPELQEEAEGGSDSMPAGKVANGLALTRDGKIMIGDIGVGSIDRLDPATGELVTLFTEIDGQPMGKVNYVLLDSKGRTWITVSTREDPWSAAMRADLADGYLLLLDGDQLRVVAEGFGFTNEIRFDAAEEWIYVAETAGRRITRLRVAEDGSLSDRETYGPTDLGHGFPDGIAFDSYGNLWVTMVFGDRVIAITPEQEVLTLLDDGNAEGNVALEEEYARGEGFSNEALDKSGGNIARWTTSITFAGPDLKTVYLGSLQGTSVPSFRSPVAGLAMTHWI